MDDTVTLHKDLIKEALTDALDKANVPQRQHLMVIKALQRRIADHQKDMQSHQDSLKSYEETLTAHEQMNTEHERQMREWDQIAQHLTSIEHLQGEPGEAGYTPIKGVDYQDGQDADEEAILSRVLEMLPNFIPDPIKGEDAEVDEDALYTKFVKRMQKERPLDITHVKNAQKFVKDGVAYKFEELMHGGGSKSSGIFSIIPVSGTINDTNETFTSATQPTLLNINGGFYLPTGGAITWSYAGGTITLSSPVGVNGSIFGI